MKFLLSFIALLATISACYGATSKYLDQEMFDYCKFEKDQLNPELAKLSDTGMKFFKSNFRNLIQLVAGSRMTYFFSAMNAYPNEHKTLVSNVPVTILSELGNRLGYSIGSVTIPDEFNYCVYQKDLKNFIDTQITNTLAKSALGTLLNAVYQSVGRDMKAYGQIVGATSVIPFTSLSQDDQTVLVKIGTLFGTVDAKSV